MYTKLSPLFHLTQAGYSYSEWKRVENTHTSQSVRFFPFSRVTFSVFRRDGPMSVRRVCVLLGWIRAPHMVMRLRLVLTKQM